MWKIGVGFVVFASLAMFVIMKGGDNAEVTFYLTRSPYCSSTLKPNPAITDNFLSADSFIIDRTERAKASTLNAVLDRLKHDSATRHIPVHIVSGLDEERRGLQCGAHGFLQKPVTHDDLKAGLEKVREFVEKPSPDAVDERV